MPQSFSRVFSSARRLAPLIGVGLAVVGCQVGQDYQVPALTDRTGDRWSDAASTQNQVRDQDTPADLVRWWQAFNDPSLTRLIETGLAQNIPLAETRERIVAARARRGITHADRLPQLDAAASYRYSNIGPEALTFNGPPAGIESDVYAWGVVAGWELDLWGRVGRLVEAADAEIDFAVEDYRAGRVSLAAEIARQYFQILALDQEIATVRASVDANRDALDIARALASAGLVDQLDPLRADRQLQANRALLPDLRGQRREAELALATLLGSPPQGFLLDEAAAELPASPRRPGLGLPADLLERRPDIRRAERDLAAATARVGSAQADRYPRVSFSGSFELQGPDLGDLTNPDADVLQLGPSVSLPIFQGGRIDANVQMAESRRRQAHLRLEQTALSAVAEVETAVARLGAAERALERLQQAEAAAADAESLAVVLYEAGNVDFLNVTDAVAERLDIRRRRVVTQRQTLVQLVNLYTALGGGWSLPATYERPTPDQRADR